MALYMTQFAYNPEAWSAIIKDPQRHNETIKTLVQRLGGKLITMYYCFGEYDKVVIFDVPDATKATAFVLAATLPGHLKAVETTRLLTLEEATSAMHTAGDLATKV
ncbi:MAG: GYD domain-containing protein [Chloroflexi bacterium]|nr:GYD domain-containing protein [Chloroflexota bacterium]